MGTGTLFGISTSFQELAFAASTCIIQQYLPGVSPGEQARGWKFLWLFSPTYQSTRDLTSWAKRVELCGVGMVSWLCPARLGSDRQAHLFWPFYKLCEGCALPSAPCLDGEP